MVSPLTLRAAFFCLFVLSRQGDEHSVLGGAEEVSVNPLEPGEEQTVTVMLEAPDFVSLGKLIAAPTPLFP